MSSSAISLAIWVLLSLLAFLLGITLFPNNGEVATYWLRMIFIEWLVAVNWLPTAAALLVVNGNPSSRYAAILPAVHVVTFTYSLVAGLVLCARIFHILPFLGEYEYIAVQAVLLVATLVVSLFMQLAVEIGVERQREGGAPGVLEPRDLAKVLSAIQASPAALADDGLLRSLRQLTERVRYSFPHDGICLRLGSYLELSRSIVNVANCAEISEPDSLSDKVRNWQCLSEKVISGLDP